MITNLKGQDLILCQITSKNVKDEYAIVISNEDFEEGSLRQESNVRPNKIFTADESIILYKIGRLKKEKIENFMKQNVEELFSFDEIVKLYLMLDFQSS